MSTPTRHCSCVCELQYFTTNHVVVRRLWMNCSITVLIFISVHRERVAIRDTTIYYNRLRIASALVVYIFLSCLRILVELLKSGSV